LSRVLSVDPGFATADLLVATLALPRLEPDAKLVAAQERIVAQAAALPGARSAAAVNILPLSSESNTIRFRLPEEPLDPGREREAHIRAASAGYFATLGARLLDGREF